MPGRLSRISAIRVPQAQDVRDLRPRVQAQALEDCRQMMLDGVLADAQQLRDAAVRFTLCDELGDLALPRRQFESIGRRGVGLKRPE